MSAAQDLINTLKDLALNAFNQATSRADGLNAAGYQVYPFRNHYGIEAADYSKILAPIVNIPPVPTVDGMIVDFDAALAQIKAVVDSVQNSWLMEYFPAAMPGGLDPLMTTILNGEIVSGVTQEIMWERAKAQGIRDAARAESEAVAQWASRGFSLPGGALNKQIMMVQQDLMFTNADLAAQQALKALDLQVDAVKFAADVGTRLRLGLVQGLTGLITAYSRLPSAAADYASAVAKARRDAYGAIAEYYRAVIAGSEMTLRADIANAENALKHLQIVASYQGQFGANQVNARVAAVDTFAKTASAALSGLNGVATEVNQTIA
jgi:hypothetical protein